MTERKNTQIYNEMHFNENVMSVLFFHVEKAVAVIIRVVESVRGSTHPPDEVCTNISLTWTSRLRPQTYLTQSNHQCLAKLDSRICSQSCCC